MQVKNEINEAFNVQICVRSIHPRSTFIDTIMIHINVCKQGRESDLVDFFVSF